MEEFFMKQYFKIISFILILTVAMMSVCIVGASADSTYTPPEEFIYGDVDMDGEVTVRDATLIQKGVAGIVYLTAVQKYLAVADSENFSVRNATAIQKHLAGLDTASSVDKVVEMAYTDKFSGAIDDDALFDYSLIFIQTKSNEYEYTLEDFPEFKFDKITYWKPVHANYTICELYLREPSRKNVIKAIEALDYRANFDIENIIPNYADTPA